MYGNVALPVIPPGRSWADAQDDDGWGDWGAATPGAASAGTSDGGWQKATTRHERREKWKREQFGDDYDPSQAAHEARIAETHVGLGRVDIDVDQRRIEREEQGRERMPVLLGLAR